MAHVQVYYHPDDSNQAPEQLLRLVAHSIRWIMTRLQFIGHKLGVQQDMMTKSSIGVDSYIMCHLDGTL